MAAQTPDSLMYLLKASMAGITSQPPAQRPEPVVEDMVDFRCLGEVIERLRIGIISDNPVMVNINTRLVNYLGSVIQFQASSLADLGGTLLYRLGASRYMRQGNTTVAAAMLYESLDFEPIRGAIGYLDYPCAGAFYITEPGALPTLMTPMAPVPSKMVFQQGNCTKVHGVAGFGKGVIGFGNYLVSYWDLQKNQLTDSSQTHLSTAGCLSRHSWAVGDKIAFWLGLDNNLYAYDGKQVQNMGFSWLFRAYSRASMWYLEQSNDLFITLDKGSGDTLVDPVTYLFHGGLTRLSKAIVSPVYNDGLIYAMTTSGHMATITYPGRSSAPEFDWDTWVPGINTTGQPDIVFGWADFYGPKEKTFTSLAVITMPMYPVSFQVTTNLGGVVQGLCTNQNPIGEITGATGSLFKVEVWFSQEATGPYRVSPLRCFVKGDDLRGMYAAAAGQVTLVG